jgi:hypothetical protein
MLLKRSRTLDLAARLMVYCGNISMSLFTYVSFLSHHRIGL